MAERVHPRDSPPARAQAAEEDEVWTPRPAPPSPDKPAPLPGTYVIQIPKEQIYHVPPRENARRFEHLSRSKHGRGGCRSCCCCLLSTILLILLAAGVAAAVIYFVFKPEAPDYAVESMAIKGFNLTSPSPLSPEFDVTVRANNPNDKIGIYYEKDSSVNIYYDGVNLCNGALPALYQPTNNVTVFKTVLTGSGIELTGAALKALRDAQNNGGVPLKLKLRAPVKLKVGSVKTWKITVKVTCDITVDKLTAAAKIVSKECDYGVDLW